MLLWLDEILDKGYSAATKLSDAACRFAEWYTHSDDIKPFSGRLLAPLPTFQDDDGDYCDDYDLFFDEYDWEANNDAA